MQVPGAAFEMGCWYQAAIQRGKTQCWDKALKGQLWSGNQNHVYSWGKDEF